MVAYLSAAWVEALDRALSGVVAPAGAGDLVVQYVVLADAPDSATADEVAAYHLDFSALGLRARPGRAGAADICFTQSLTTARRVARGELSAQLAVLVGDVTIEGDTAPLVPWRRLLDTELSAAMTALAAVTRS